MLHQSKNDKAIKLNIRLYAILLISIVIAYASSLWSVLYTMEYRFMQDIKVEITGIELNKEGNTFLYPYVIKYETLDHEQVGTFKSVYKYQWDEKNTRSSIVDLKLDAKNNVVDGTNESLVSMLSFIITVVLIVLNLGLRGFYYFKYYVGNNTFDSKAVRMAVTITIPIAIIVFVTIFLYNKEEKNFTAFANKQVIKIVSVEKRPSYISPMYTICYVTKGDTEQNKFYSAKIYVKDDEKSYHTVNIAGDVDETSFLYMQYMVMLTIGGYLSITLLLYVIYRIRALSSLSGRNK